MRSRSSPFAAIDAADTSGAPDLARSAQIDFEAPRGLSGTFTTVRPSTKAGWITLAAAATLTAAWGVLASSPQLAVPAIFLGWTLLLLAASDMRAFLLPNPLTFALAVGGLAVVVLDEQEALAARLVAMAAGGAILILAGMAYRALRGRDGLGLGDAKLLAAAGAWVGLDGLPSVVLIGSVAGLAFGLSAARVTGGRTATLRVPFGAFLALGVWLTWLYGPIDLVEQWDAPW